MSNDPIQGCRPGSRGAPARLGLGEHDNSRYRRENLTANGEKGDRGRGERRGLAALKRPSKRAMATGSDDEQGEREHRVAAPEHDVCAVAAWSRRGASLPTPSAPAVATKAVRHHASQVLSAAIPTFSAVSASALCGVRSATAAILPCAGAAEQGRALPK